MAASAAEIGVREQVCPLFTPADLCRPRSRVRASQDVCGGTIWQDAVCHVGELALPTCEWPDASQPNPLLSHGTPSGSGCHGDGRLVDALRDDEKKGMDGGREGG